MFRKLKEKKGFTLIELMIVIAILGVLAAVAIPQYMNYVVASKERATRSNFDSAVKLVNAEFSKVTAGIEPTDDIIAALNDAGQRANKNPYQPAVDAFAIGTTPGTAADAGSVYVELGGIANQTGGANSIEGIVPGEVVVISGVYIDKDNNLLAIGPTTLTFQ